MSDNRYFQFMMGWIIKLKKLLKFFRFGVSVTSLISMKMTFETRPWTRTLRPRRSWRWWGRPSWVKPSRRRRSRWRRRRRIKKIRSNNKRMLSSMIHLVRPTVPPVVITILTRKLFWKLGTDGRTDTTYENSDHCWACMSPSGSIEKFIIRTKDNLL